MYCYVHTTYIYIYIYVVILYCVHKVASSQPNASSLSPQEVHFASLRSFYPASTSQVTEL